MRNTHEFATVNLHEGDCSALITKAIDVSDRMYAVLDAMKHLLKPNKGGPAEKSNTLFYLLEICEDNLDTLATTPSSLHTQFMRMGKNETRMHPSNDFEREVIRDE